LIFVERESAVRVFCPECQSTEELSIERWRCDCGSAWEPIPGHGFRRSAIDGDNYSVWRYRGLFDLEDTAAFITLGEGWTPLLSIRILNRSVLAKAEFLSPTGSFKDRGTCVMINVLRAQGATRVADDSSGNAGASVAAYAARAGIGAEIYVPAYASPAKQAQIAVYGADVVPVPGPRENAKHAAFQAADRGVAFASHAYHPGFLVGQQSVAWELWEQLGSKAPDCIVFPVGQGLHLLGAWLGFKRLHEEGLIERLPRLVAVQAANLAPLCEAFWAGLDYVPGVEPVEPSIAEGLAINRPVRGKRLLAAIKETGGSCIAVSDQDILTAQRLLAENGLFVEPTSATAAAALMVAPDLAGPNETLVLPLTGSGLKGTPRLSG
jgi:threonine synthase